EELVPAALARVAPGQVRRAPQAARPHDLADAKARRRLREISSTPAPASAGPGPRSPHAFASTAPVGASVQWSRAVLAAAPPAGLARHLSDEQVIPAVRRRGRDSNPRPGEHPAAVFMTVSRKQGRPGSG